MEQSRWKSPVLWSALAALIFFVVKEWIGYEIPGWDRFIVLLIAALTAFGIINSPDNKNSL